MAQKFGYAVVKAQAQSAEGLIPAANPARPCFLESSVCVIAASFYDNTGQPMMPQGLTYAITDVLSGEQILTPTAIESPQSVTYVTVTGSQNAMVSNSRTSETHQVLFSVTDPSSGGPFEARCLFDILT